MTKPNVELVQIGKYKKAAQDKALKLPAKLAKLLVPDPDGWVDLATDGTWFEFKREIVEVKVGKKKVQSTKKRLCWIQDGAVKRAADVVVCNNAPSFDRARGVAYLACHEAKLMQLSLADGALSPVEVRGIDFGKKADAPLFECSHALEDGRVVIALPTNPTKIYVCERGKAGLDAKLETTLFHTFTVVRGRVLVGGGTQLFALAFGPKKAHVLAHFPEVDNDMMRVVDDKPRFYGGKGAFEVQGLDAAWEAFVKRPEDFPVYSGWPEGA
ncbi:MAG: hypothetical protein IPM79_34770 [Polyangiaceae bacterium]|jgi:hypothetical protein|nr:hypothetical protein [Polyangiaceae bacterium]MBK8942622.1 hypothetical protein [Polyangiaceae bacterium]